MDIPEIDVDQLAQRLDQGDGVLLDVRRRDEWEDARIDRATLITLDELGDRIGEVPTDAPILVICRSGGRSAAATEALIGAGIDATNVAGGMLAWIESGRAVISGEV